MIPEVWRFVRFAIVGVVNTLVTFIIYSLLLQYFSIETSYSLAFVAGVIISYVGNTIYVFSIQRTFSSLMRFPIVYVIQYLYGLGVLQILTHYIGLQPELAMIVVVISAVPLTFAFTKLTLMSSSRSAPTNVVEEGDTTSDARGGEGRR